MNDEDELLDPGRPPLPRPARVAAIVVIIAALATLFAVRLWPGPDEKHHQAALGPAPSASAPSPPPSGGPARHDWPTARSGCGGTTDLSIVASRPPAERTGLTLLLGGRQLRVVDFDTGQVKPLPDGPTGTFVATLTGAPPAYATTMTCGGLGRSRVLRVGTDRSVQDLGSLKQDQSLLADGDQAWVATTPAGRRHSFIQPLGGHPVVRLPKDMYVVGIENNVLVGFQPGSDEGPGTLLLLDPATGRVEKRVGSVNSTVGFGAGRVLWTSGCDPGVDAPCRLDALSLADGTRQHYPLPRPVLGGTPSPDGSQVALLLEADRDRQLDDQHPFPPSQIAVLDLPTGRLHVVPGITLPAKEFPGLAFDANSRWLAIALDAGTKTRMLAWRAGLGRAYETAPVPGANYGGSPPLVTMPARTG